MLLLWNLPFTLNPNIMVKSQGPDHVEVAGSKCILMGSQQQANLRSEREPPIDPKIKVGFRV